MGLCKALLRINELVTRIVRNSLPKARGFRSRLAQCHHHHHHPQRHPARLPAADPVEYVRTYSANCIKGLLIQEVFVSQALRRSQSIRVRETGQTRTPKYDYSSNGTSYPSLTEPLAVREPRCVLYHNPCIHKLRLVPDLCRSARYQFRIVCDRK
jgi:hypothetical protein